MTTNIDHNGPEDLEEDPNGAAAIIADANELAQQFYALMGYVVPDGYRFDRAQHPQERLCWSMVEAAYEQIASTTLSEILAELEDA